MKQCKYVFCIVYRTCRSCNGLNTGCKCYTPGDNERESRTEHTVPTKKGGSHRKNSRV